jgi:hypothetical protein
MRPSRPARWRRRCGSELPRRRARPAGANCLVIARGLQ